MKILINFATLKKGGGQNVALNFLNAESFKADKNEYFFFVAEGSSILRYLQKNNYTNFLIVPANPVFRIMHELFFSRKTLKKFNADIIYSYFGVGLYAKKYPQVAGSAYSNLFFPEVDFWKEYTGLSLLKRRIVDKYRLWSLKRAKGIIFENKVIEERCHHLYDFDATTTTIMPSIDVNFEQEEYSLPVNITHINVKTGLFLCGWHLNKNIMLIPEIAHHMKQKNFNFHFILTAPPDNSKHHKKFIDLMSRYNVSDMISVIGPIKKRHLKSLYHQVDLVFLLSKLESFSNNIIEAWTYKKALIISDELWARSLCKDAAIYVNRDSAEHVAETVKNVVNDIDLYNGIVAHGNSELKNYPTVNEKCKQEINFLKRVYEIN